VLIDRRPADPIGGGARSAGDQVVGDRACIDNDLDFRYQCEISARSCHEEGDRWDRSRKLAWFGGGNPKARFNAGYGDRRMSSTTDSTDMTEWQNLPTEFDNNPGEFQVLYGWVAQGALDN
jgi:hypothetical protein